MRVHRTMVLSQKRNNYIKALNVKPFITMSITIMIVIIILIMIIKITIMIRITVQRDR